MQDRHPRVIAEVRGEGLLIGLRAEVPAGTLVDALRDETLITVSAGEDLTIRNASPDPSVVMLVLAPPPA